MEIQTKWYQRTWGILALLVFFFPLGLYLMWKHAKWNGIVKLMITGFFALITFIGVSDGKSENNKASTPNTEGQQVNTTEVKASPTLVVTSTQVEKLDIVVTSQIIKRVDKKYRYFFDIRNKDTQNFEGSVSITLFTDKSQNALAGDTFSTKAPIEPGLGTSVYFDAHTGPVSQHGEYGMTKYKYVVKVNGVEVNSGEGQPTDKFEDTDAYSF